MMPKPGFQEIPYKPWIASGDPLDAVKKFGSIMSMRRSVRAFSTRDVPRELIDSIISVAGTAPSGANKQPWRFIAVSDPEIKKAIREGAEEEEASFYTQRASTDWLHDLEIIGTDERKPFLEQAPWLIVVFKLMKDDREIDESDRVYYVNESVGISVGLLLAAAQQAGLATLTHTPSPMKFLGTILGRPDYERPFMLIPIGWPADDAMVPDIHRKSLSEIMVLNRGDES